MNANPSSFEHLSHGDSHVNDQGSPAPEHIYPQALCTSGTHSSDVHSNQQLHYTSTYSLEGLHSTRLTAEPTGAICQERLPPLYSTPALPIPSPHPSIHMPSVTGVVQPHIGPRSYRPTGIHSSNLQLTTGYIAGVHSQCKCGCDGILIPQGVFPTPKWTVIEGTQIGYLIKFSVNHQCGISAANALEQDFSGLEGRDECIFEGVDCKPTASLRINWIGYKPWSSTIRTVGYQTTTPKPVILSQLTHKIAKRLQQFFQEKQQEPFDLPQDARWQIGPGVIEFDKLILVGLERVSPGSWMPHFRLSSDTTLRI